MVDVVLLGAGKLGAAAVERWVDAGRDVVVWNRTTARAEELAGPRVTPVTDLSEAVTDAPVVVSILTDGHALRDVLVDSGAIEAMQPRSLLVDLSTVDVASSAAVADKAAEHDVRYLRGAVSGTAAVLRSGSAGLLLSGPEEALAAARPLLDDLSGNQVVVGQTEEARVVKLAANMLLAGTMQAVAEALVMAEGSGVSREVVLDALDSSVLASKFLSYKGEALRKRDYTATFRTSDLRKDMRLALDQAKGVGTSMPVTERIEQQLASACDDGWADSDFLSLVRLLQQESGADVDPGE
jgi:3-hydroxyisobutyrate dehydrogenase-like beta-hydroxyacid dehydrogenase